MRRFEGETVLVTGGSRGLGAAMAGAFGDEGAHVFVGYRIAAEEAAQVVAGIVERGGSAAVLAMDVRSPESVRQAVDQASSSAGRIKILVNNAGINRDGWFAMMSEDDWAGVIDTDLSGAWRVARAVVRSMMGAGKGVVINVGSIAGLRASPGQAAYAAAKGGLIALTRTLAAELAGRGIRVNAVIPGMCNAGMGSRLDHGVRQQRLTQIPLGRFAEADEIARAVLFLASDDASYIVGQSLVVDGGLSL